ncbi:hypothetical protein PHMEG_00025441, partial [Phytophthora megakarya]
LNLYSVSPTIFFDADNKRLFPPAKQFMSFNRYSAVLNALGTNHELTSTSNASWTALFLPDCKLTDAMDALRKICSSLGFVNKISIASLFGHIGLTKTRNSKKGYN